MDTNPIEHQFEHYLQGHFHPDVAPQVRREVRLETVTMETFLRLAGIFQANHDALDEQMVAEDTARESQVPDRHPVL